MQQLIILVMLCLTPLLALSQEYFKDIDIFTLQGLQPIQGKKFPTKYIKKEVKGDKVLLTIYSDSKFIHQKPRVYQNFEHYWLHIDTIPQKITPVETNEEEHHYYYIFPDKIVKYFGGYNTANKLFFWKFCIIKTELGVKKDLIVRYYRLTNMPTELSHTLHEKLQPKLKKQDIVSEVIYHLIDKNTLKIQENNPAEPAYYNVSCDIWKLEGGFSFFWNIYLESYLFYDKECK